MAKQKHVAVLDASPVQDVSRRIRPAVDRLLYVRAGGRCEFAGCNQYLLEHPLTKAVGNFGQKAHVVAFRTRGPRGHFKRPDDINAVDNLMLLCPACHKGIDDDPVKYPREVLETYKNEHERRILLV